MFNGLRSEITSGKMEVIISFEDRSVVLNVGTGTHDELKEAFKSEIQWDPSLMYKTKNFMPVFWSHNSKFGRGVELQRSCNLYDGQEIQVTWAPLGEEENNKSDKEEYLRNLDLSSNNSKQTPPIIIDQATMNNLREDRSPGRELLVDTGSGKCIAVAMSQDGHCLFSAIAHQLDSTLEVGSAQFEEAAKNLRRKAVEIIKMNSKHYKETIENVVTDLPDKYTQKTIRGKVKAYISNLEKGTEWGAEECLVALSAANNLAITVLQEVQSEALRKNAAPMVFEHSNPTRHISIVYRVSLDPEERMKAAPKRNHYDSFKEFVEEESNNTSQSAEKVPPSGAGIASNSQSHAAAVPLTLTQRDSTEAVVEAGNSPDRRKSLDDNSDSDSSGTTTARTYYDEKVWENMSETEKMVENNRLQQYLFLVQRGLITSEFKVGYVDSPEKKRPRAPQNSKWTKYLDKPEVTKVTPVPLDRALRPRSLGNDSAQKRNMTATAESSFSDPDDDGLEVDEQNSTSPEKRPDKENIRPPRPKAGNPKKKRLIGQYITYANAMPTFSQAAKEQLALKVPLLMHPILADVKQHIQLITGGLVITRNEYKILGEVIVQAYPCLADADDIKSSRGFRNKLSKSISGKKNYLKNKKPRIEAARLQRQMAKDQHQLIVQVEDKLVDELADKDKQLRALSPGNDENRVLMKSLIFKTWEIRSEAFERAMKKGHEDAKEQWGKYPHLKDSALMAYDYSIQVGKSIVQLKENYNKMITQLRTYFQVDEETETARQFQEFRILVSLQEEITPRIFVGPQTHYCPAIEIQDATEAEGMQRIQTSHNIQAPCVLVVTAPDPLGQERAEKSYLKQYQGVQCECYAPTGFDVVLQLLGGYFIGHIEYPHAYKSLLRFLEKKVNGELSSNTLQKRAQVTYNQFMKKLE